MVLDEKGRIASVAPRERLDAHKLIEDYMIAANVAAAKALEAKKAPVMYRDHEPPGREKLVALKDYLKTFEIEFALGQVDPARPPSTASSSWPAPARRSATKANSTSCRRSWSRCCAPRPRPITAPRITAISAWRSAPTPISPARSAAMPTSSSTALWSAPTGSARSEKTGLTDQEAEAMEVTGELISQLERRAMEAERDTLDRYVAAYLSEQVGDLVRCRITGVQPFGFFATVEGLGGDGLVPVSTLGERIFPLRGSEPDPGRRARAATDLRAGQRLKLRLAEANPVSGGLQLRAARRAARRRPRATVAGPAPRPESESRRQGRRGRPANIRHRGRR